MATNNPALAELYTMLGVADLPRISEFLGRKQGGSIVERNPNTYNMRAI